VRPAVQIDPIPSQYFVSFWGILHPAQYSVDAGGQLTHAEGFDHVIIRAKIQAKDRVSFLLAGSDDYDRRLTLLAKLAQELIAVHFGHHDIEEDQVGLFVAGSIECVLAVGSRNHPETLFGKVILNKLAYAGLIIYNKDRLGHLFLAIS
jgi:septum formation topological specificity factor MinE